MSGPRPILMSIQPRYANALMAGEEEKSHEFRKQSVQPGTPIVVYRSGRADQRGIIGMFAAGQVLNGIAAHLHRTVARPGIDLAGLLAYGACEHGQRQLFAIPATKVRRLAGDPLPLVSVGVGTAPQSWCYLSEAGFGAFLGVLEQRGGGSDG